MFFGFHLSNVTFPGTPDAQLLDRFAELATTAEAESGRRRPTLFVCLPGSRLLAAD